MSMISVSGTYASAIGETSTTQSTLPLTQIPVTTSFAAPHAAVEASQRAPTSVHASPSVVPDLMPAVIGGGAVGVVVCACPLLLYFVYALCTLKRGAKLASDVDDDMCNSSGAGGLSEDDDTPLSDALGCMLGDDAFS